jgi:hypothetical protein
LIIFSVRYGLIRSNTVRTVFFIKLINEYERKKKRMNGIGFRPDG